MIDTHSHIYSEEFDLDRKETIERALAIGVKKILLPNIDLESIEPMMQLASQYPQNCFPMMGLHPTSVNENYEQILNKLWNQLSDKKVIAIGETGIDLYWDKTFQKEQEKAFVIQIEWAKKMNLPLVIHIRNSFDETFKILEENYFNGIAGVFHAFSGTVEQAARAIDLGFKLGVGGVVTFKNSGLDKIISELSLDHLILETDAPYLTPVPFRGKRNESSYVQYVAQKLADIFNESEAMVIQRTTENANKLFNLDTK